MFKIYSKGCEYLLKALSNVNWQKSEEIFSAKQICRKAKVPEASTRKMLQDLVKHKLLVAIPGPGGGYRFARSLKSISVYDIIRAIDGKEAMNRCIMDFPKCNELKPCPIHDSWKKIKLLMVTELSQQTMEEFLKFSAKVNKS